MRFSTAQFSFASRAVKNRTYPITTGIACFNVTADKVIFPGGRTAIKKAAAEHALRMVLSRLDR